MSTSFDTEHESAEYESVSNLAQNVVLHVQGCTDIEVRKALQTAYADFCRLSSCYCIEREVRLEPGKHMYGIPGVVPGCFVDSITSVTVGSRRLVECRDYRIVPGASIIDLMWHAVPEEPTHDQLLSRPELSMHRPCDTMRVTAIEIPRLGSEKAPRWFFDKYGEAVVAGALVKLFGMTGKAWTDGVRAQHELIRWENFLTDARLRSVYTGGSGSGSGSISALDTSGLL